MAMSTLHSTLESGIMCLFNRDHISATARFDEDCKFSTAEMALQRVHRRKMNGSSTLLSLLEATMYLCQAYCTLKSDSIHLRSRLLLYDPQIGPAEKVRLLKAVHCNVAEIKTTPRAIDYLRGTRELEDCCKIDLADLMSAIENWRSARNATTLKAATEEEAEAHEPPTKTQTTT